MPVAARVGSNGDFFLSELRAFLGLGPVSIVSKKMALKVSLEQSIKAIDIVAVASNLYRKGNPSFRSENQMLTNTVKPTFQRGAVSRSGKSSEPLFFACSNGAADIDGMGINDEKGGLSSPSISTNAFERRSMSGVRMARRSANWDGSNDGEIRLSWSDWFPAIDRRSDRTRNRKVLAARPGTKFLGRRLREQGQNVESICRCDMEFLLLEEHRPRLNKRR